MDQRLPRPTPMSSYGLFSIAAGAGLMFATLVGCGGSESPDASVVTPPSPSGAEAGQPAAATSGRSDPPGGIELPPGDIPLPGSEEAPQSEGIEMPTDATVPDQSGTSIEPRILYATWDEIETEAKTNARVTVVDLWSLTCEPCLREFPGLVRIHETLGSSVQCIAVDMDFDGRRSRPPEHYEERVAAFLRGVRATGFPTYISRTPSDDVFAAMKLASLPAVLVYNARGEITRVFVDAGDTAGFTYEQDIIPFVAEMAGT